MNIKEEMKYTWSTLKDFQKNTVNRVIKSYDSGYSRFLVADEVGLGKTIVAKGVIAKLYQKAHDENREFKVVYVCSNLQLANQNLSKLNPFSRQITAIESTEVIHQNEQGDDRISFLGYDDKELSKSKIEIINKLRISMKAITPGTSLKTAKTTGKVQERVLLFSLLESTSGFNKRKTALRWFLMGGVNNTSWNNYIDRSSNRQLRRGVKTKFLDELYEPLDNPELLTAIRIKVLPKLSKNYTLPDDPTLMQVLKKIIQSHNTRSISSNFYDKDEIRPIRNQLIGELRHRLMKACMEFLDADLYILDEFQRFSQIIDAENAEEDPSIELAREIFKQKKAKVLMLSATPFKAYTTSTEVMAGEDHYSEFKKVLEFLFEQKDPKIMEEITAWNLAYFEGLKNVDLVSEKDSELLKTKGDIEKKYTKVLSRTERLLVEPAEIEPTPPTLLDVKEEDIIEFITLDKLVKSLNDKHQTQLNAPVEYVKSSPYPLSFLGDYVHFERLKKHFNADREIRGLVTKAKHAFIDPEKIKNYRALIPETSKSQIEPNPKLRLLYEDLRESGWALLWVPPSIPYYSVNQLPFKNQYNNNQERFSKSLIFSAWKMVPRMVSTLTSYEAERKAVNEYIKKHPKRESSEKVEYGTNKKRFPGRLWEYSSDADQNSMAYFALTYPSPSLAQMIDPSEYIGESLTQSGMLDLIKKNIADNLINEGIMNIGVEGGKDYWKWYAPILLDQSQNKESQISWLKNYNSHHLQKKDKRSNTKSSIRNIIMTYLSFMQNGSHPKDIKKLSKSDFDELVTYLAKITLASPAVTALRTLSKLFPASESYSPNENVLAAAHDIANSFRGLFNKSENIAVVRAHFFTLGYHNNVLDYCVNGNIQAMLDEYFYQLKDSANKNSPNEIAEVLRKILSLDARTLGIKSRNSLKIQSNTSGKTKRKDSGDIDVRVHYAQHYGLTQNTGERPDEIREAFNSPFRPFILCSTSIGQEGLDFHFYCDHIVHWNLPHNPIDLEQREGRIKRYKGYNIRKQICADLDNNDWPKIIFLMDTLTLWEAIYKYVEENKKGNSCDLIPFWYYPNPSDPKKPTIKSTIQIYPYSVEESMLENIKNVLANYRLTFGQPRQEELIYVLGENSENKKYRENLPEFLLNLCPTEKK